MDRDENFPSDSDKAVIDFVVACRHQSENARRTRVDNNTVNMLAYNNIQDFGKKMDGQSREFLPKTAVAVEQFISFIKKSIVQFGDWYTIEHSVTPTLPISPIQTKALIDYCGQDCGPGGETLQTQITDAIRIAALESLCIFKIHGVNYNRTVYGVEGPQTVQNWKLRVDLVPFEDYFPDPTGRNLYEIHRCERDLFEVVARANEGVYDLKAVKNLVDSYERADSEKRQDYKAQQNDPGPIQERVTCVVEEFWGTILDRNGKVIHENIFCAIANDKYVIRKPTRNPFWHGESPFVRGALIRVPFSVFHRALYDAAAKLNLALNEIFNLILDGGIAAVWGVRQLRVDALVDETQVSNGIPQGETLLVRNTLPPGQKVIEQCTEGDVPGDAMAVYEAISREFASAAMSNELKMGSMPAKDVRATEVIELSQSVAALLEGVIIEVEDIISRVIHKCLLVIMQHYRDLPDQGVANVIGELPAAALGIADRFSLYQVFSEGSAVKVEGVSAQMGRQRDFQRFAALLQIVSTNPLLMMAFFQEYNPSQVLAHLMRLIGFDHLKFIRDAQATTQMTQQLKLMPQILQMMNPGKGGEGGSNMPGNSMPNEANQMANPLTGLGVGGDA